eukprot:1180472-Prorocentrum_minimum.AAC.1
MEGSSQVSGGRGLCGFSCLGVHDPSTPVFIYMMEGSSQVRRVFWVSPSDVCQCVARGSFSGSGGYFGSARATCASVWREGHSLGPEGILGQPERRVPVRGARVILWVRR